ncbi:MAG: hypothetical protein ACSLEN_11875 [Candidatus Malihini olakiniferum]
MMQTRIELAYLISPLNINCLRQVAFDNRIDIEHQQSTQRLQQNTL